ncbi:MULTISPECIES: hypothetical protein [Clostridium]|uniref:Uncharacterized protein n=1 Tax=Clostridium novyi B str. ATCC 27606 TaxID=1443123 RepID=A0AA40IRU1_CLONO|nr:MULTISPECIES: hypothetical protein [Clostridium]MCD3202875.1 hypothetical protein [Clostridium botulinum C/D]KEI08153.1 hypothetical protein Z958_p0033 [Clostridium novyi B str. NCTC 9691]KEI11492.1 hypothetical protein Z959_p0058 [Clostridium novyi B str. ATCC 27606]KLU74261.1 hypothetical protein CBC3_p0262 [Clostridium botulinum V891]MCD3230838.1 hypothetical protein [Clostridium botulinum C/D]
MKIGKILKTQQPDVYKRLKKQHKTNKAKKNQNSLTFNDYIDLMRHDSYKRHNGAIRQVR